MSNALTTTNMPQHLQVLMQHSALQTMNDDAVKGISAGSWPRISLKGGRFRLQDPQGQEFVVPQHWLDVIIVAVNPAGLSKIYYEGVYDPNGDGTAPTCYSDNGVAPSARASKPQCGTCAACPHNIWGSKITPAGAQVKACADIKKVAVLLADNTSGPVFELRIPAASLTNFGAYVRGLSAAGKPAASIVTRLQFDTNADYPKLQFDAPVINGDQPLLWHGYPYITQDMLQDVLEVINSEEVKLCTGQNDKPREVPVGAAATSVIAQNQPMPGVAGLPPQPAYGPVRAPLENALPPAPPPAGTRQQHVSGAPLPQGAVGPVPPANPAFPHAGQPAQAAPAPAAPAKRRTRKAAAENAPELPLAQPAVYVPPMPPMGVAPGQPGGHPPAGGGDSPAFLYRAPAANAAPVPPATARDAAAPVNVGVTNASLDDLLSQAMRT